MSHSSRKRTLKRNRTLALEVLEQRCLPSWAPIGPAPQLQNLAGPTVGITAPGTKLSGRVSDLALMPEYYSAGHPALLNGSASGGVFISSDLSAAGVPTWTTSTDRVGLAGLGPDRRGIGALRTGSIAVSPWHERRVRLRQLRPSPPAGFGLTRARGAVGLAVVYADRGGMSSPLACWERGNRLCRGRRCPKRLPSPAGRGDRGEGIAEAPTIARGKSIPSECRS